MLAFLAALGLAGVALAAAPGDVVVGNARFTLTIGADACVESLLATEYDYRGTL